MKTGKKATIIMLILAILITGCTAKQETAETEETGYVDVSRPPYQKEQILNIAFDSDFGSHFNPFVYPTKGEEMILSVIFTSPLKSNIHGELIPWNGNIISGKNADGSISYIVNLDSGLKFTDGTPIDIDDYIYSLYIKADPNYNGPDPLLLEDIRGIRSYYYDDENWEENLGKLERYVEDTYSEWNISQDDYIHFLIETDIDGLLDKMTPDEWKSRMMEDGWETEVKGVKTEEDLIALIALYEYAENMEMHDPMSWYRENLERAYIKRNLDGDVHVSTISGIERINPLTAKITLDSVNPDTVKHLNAYMVPSHYYGPFEKGKLEHVLSKNIPLGAGAYSFYAEYEDKVVLNADNNYREGIPNIGSVVFHEMDEESIIQALNSGSIDIGLLSGKTESLKQMSSKIRCCLIPNGKYPSIFLNANTLERDDRINLYYALRRVVKYLPLSPIEKKVEHPLSPLIPEYPDTLSQLRIPETRESIGKRDDIVLLIDSSIPRENMQKFLKDLHTELSLIGNTVKESHMERDEIEKLMKEGKADACIIPSSGTLDEKMDMYHSESKDNIQNIDDPMIDEILENLITGISLDERRKLADMLSERIESEGLEVPLYQNRAIIAYNTSNLDMESLPEVSTSSWNFLSTIWSLRKR